MAKQEAEGESPLKPDIDDEVARLVDAFRDRLMTTALEISRKSRKGQEGITTEHVEAAYRRIITPSDGPRHPAQKNITAAIKANRAIEYVSYLMATVLFFLGLFLIAYGVFGPVEVRVAALVGGPLTSLLLFLPWRFAINARRHNIAISLLGFLLDQAGHDSRLLAHLIQRLLSEVASGKSHRADRLDPGVNVKSFWQILDEWLFSPPYRFVSVLRMTDVLLCASDPEYAAERLRQKEPSTTPPVPEEQPLSGPPPPDVHAQE